MIHCLLVFTFAVTSFETLHPIQLLNGEAHTPTSFMMKAYIGTRGALGARAPRFAVNNKVPFSFGENVPFLRKKCPRSIVPPNFEMVPTSLGEILCFSRKVVSF